MLWANLCCSSGISKSDCYGNGSTNTDLELLLVDTYVVLIFFLYFIDSTFVFCSCRLEILNLKVASCTLKAAVI